MATEIPENVTSENATAETSTRSRPRWGRILVWVGLLGLLTILALGLKRAQQGPVAVGSRSPGFSLTAFDGQQYKLSDLKGKVVVVNFWASWCKPCEEEAAVLESGWQYYKPRSDVVFLGVDYVDTEPEAKAYLKKFNVTYPNGPDLATRISQSFRIQGVPETYVIDRNGTLRHMQYGVFPSLADIQAVVDPLLSQ
jgi:cytochrome c biogenesis protein CcmG, thiol:disulfide interchange protein DsbE